MNQASKPQNNQAEPISQAQMRRIWAMAREQHMDKDMLHDLVANVTGSNSISSLSKKQGVKVIEALSRIGQSGHDRPDRASKEQIWKIRQYEKELGWDDNPKRLEGFIKRYGSVDKPEWLTPAKAWRVIEALKKMAARTVDSKREIKV